MVSNGDPAEVRALRLALNRIIYDAKWDDERLRIEFRELAALGFDLDLTDFEQVEIDMVLDLEPPVLNGVEETARDLASASEPPVVAMYDIFRAGRHRLACVPPCDQLRASVVVERPVSAVLADPRYNVKIAGFVSGLGCTGDRDFAMASGEITASEFVDFLADSLAALLPELGDNAILYLCMEWRHKAELLEAAGRHALELKKVYVWCKTHAGDGSFHRSQHEFVFVFKRGTGGHQNQFEPGRHGRSRNDFRTYAGVNNLGKNRVGARSAGKPWKIIAEALRDISRERDDVIDPFLGSGSTLIAAEQTGRNCIAVDVDPANIEVAIRRWQKRTGCDAIHLLTGEIFDELVERKRAETRSQAAGPEGHRGGRATDGGVTDG